MQIIPTSLPEVLCIEPKVFGDARGFFFESFNARQFEQLTGVQANFVQDNHSRSARNVLRGLHYQIQCPQGKLVRVTAGAVLDVVVDIRKSSPTFGKWSSTLLSDENKLQLWVPPGFAHGFAVLSETAAFLYKTTDYWMPEHERCLLWDDPAVGIEWNLTAAPVLSDKDRLGKPLADAEVFA
jgi:dTDP-4-dehydrorhamnose 3,5-epimerase